MSRSAPEASGHPPLAPRLTAALRDPKGKRAALIPYVTGGFPTLDASAEIIAMLVESGADAVELGIPFSDPVADGPVVQRTSQLALEAGTTPDDVFSLASRFAGRLPLVLLVYANTVAAYGEQRFAEQAAASGIEALVVPDLPVDEAGSLTAAAREHGVGVVPLAAPTSTDARLDLMASVAAPFIYCVAVTGVTGARAALGTQLARLTARLRTRTATPLVAGFGISTPAQAAAAAALADGVIVGSALLQRLLDAPSLADGLAEARALLHGIARALATPAAGGRS